MAEQHSQQHGAPPPKPASPQSGAEQSSVLTGEQPKPPTPLDPPQIYHNTIWRVPAIVATTQEQADALDPNEWLADPPPAAPKKAPPKPSWPQLYANVNVGPKIVADAGEAKALGGDWKQFDLPESLVKSAQAQIDAQKQAASQAQNDTHKKG